MVQPDVRLFVFDAQLLIKLINEARLVRIFISSFSFCGIFKTSENFEIKEGQVFELLNIEATTID